MMKSQLDGGREGETTRRWMVAMVTISGHPPEVGPLEVGPLEVGLLEVGPLGREEIRNA